MDHDRDHSADAGGPEHHAARPPLRPRGRRRRVFGTAGGSKRPLSTMHYRRPSRRARPSSSKAFARSARARHPSLPKRSRRFTTQEAIHSREHDAFNKRAAEAGYDLSKLEAQVEKRLAITRSKPPIVSLAATMALEHFTAILAHQLLANPRHLEGAERETADLWRWHACEEIEHKGVAYDTWLHATRHWPRWKRWKVKAKVMLYVTRNFVVDRTAGALELMRQDGVTGLRAWAALLWYLWVRPGHVPQDRGRVAQVLPAAASIRGTRTTGTCCARTTRRRHGGAAAQAQGEAGAASAGRGAASASSSATTSAAAAAASAAPALPLPRAQLIRGAMIPRGSKPSFSSTRADAGLSMKCDPSSAASPSVARDLDQRRARLGREAAAPEGTSDPVAHLDRARRAPAQAAGADQARRAVACARRSAAREGPDRAGSRGRPRRRACG